MFEYFTALVCLWLVTGFIVSLVNRGSWYLTQEKYLIVDGDEYLNKSCEACGDILCGPLAAARKSWEQRYYINKTNSRLQ